MNAYLDSILAKGYTLLFTLDHNQIIPFVQKNLKLKTTSAIGYLVINFSLIVFLSYKFGSTLLSLDEALVNFGLGIFACLLLIPIHEWIHGLAYYFLGAKHISFKANIKKFVFYAMADKFIVNVKQFRMVAIAPFLIITACLLSGFFFASESASFLLLGAVLFHTGACSGDFGMMSYLDSISDAEVISYDDSETEQSYFLQKL